jgi:hypothetical protein
MAEIQEKWHRILLADLIRWFDNFERERGDAPSGNSVLLLY